MGMDENDLLGGLDELSAAADMKQPKQPATDQKPPAPTPAPAKPSPSPSEKPQKPQKVKKAQEPDKDKAPDTEPAPPAKPRPRPGSANYSLYFLIFSVGGLILFALGAGFGAMVSSGRFPGWDKGPGFLHALSAWVMAPAGILILPIIAGAFFLAGLELREEKKHAGTFFGMSLLLLIVTGAMVLMR